MLNRYKNIDLIQQLDPEKNFWQIYHFMLGYEFPSYSIQALEVALMRTYYLPSISKLLNKTREFIYLPQKRYDDTSIMLTEIIQWGLKSERGQEALQRMNSIHRRL
jgi:hypothetical protein